MTFSFFSSQQLLILSSLWLTFLLSFVTRLAWPSLLPIINGDLQLTTEQGAYHLSAFYIGYALAVLPGGLLADRIGYRKGILISLLGMALITALMSTIESYEYGLLLRLLLGIVSGPIHASCLSAIGHHFSDKKRGTATGLFMSCTSFGISVVNLYAPWIAHTYHWSMAFLVTALLPLLVFFYSYRVLPKEDLREEEKHPIRSLDCIREVLQNRNIRLLALAGFFATGTTWGIANWTNLYLVNTFHISPVVAGTFMSLYGLAAWLSAPIIGFTSDKLPIRKYRLASIVMLLFSIVLIVFASISNTKHLIWAAPLLGIGAFMHITVTNTLVVELAEPHLRATTAGFVNVFNQIGSLLSPIFLSCLLDVTGTYPGSFLAISLMPLLGAIALAFIHDKKALPNHNITKF